jgi:hypothetical protein
MERINEYFAQLMDAIRNCRWVINEDLTFRQIDLKEGYINGILYIHGGYMLHVAEYIEIEKGFPKRIKYRYQLQDNAERLVSRWDNAPHHAQIPTHPHHVHDDDGAVHSSHAMDIPSILAHLDAVFQEK